MTTKTKTPRKKRTRSISQPTYILLDVSEKWREQLGKTRSVNCKHEDDIAKVLQRATRDSLWISSRSDMTDTLLRAISHLYASTPKAGLHIGDLLMLESPRARTLPALRNCFEHIVGEDPSFKMLPDDQLSEVIGASDVESRDVFIGGSIDTKIGLLTFVRGNIEQITVPISIFRPSGTSKPNFRKFELDDYGHTVRFGDYEAAADFILYEADPEYRKRMNAKRRAEDKGFGPSLRRLRIQRGVARDAFPGVASKTIARIERGDVNKPHGETLNAISNTLGVSPGEIETF
jgi:hypothetical protein